MTKLWGCPHTDAGWLEHDDGHLQFIGEDEQDTPYCYSFEQDEYDTEPDDDDGDE